MGPVGSQVVGIVQLVELAQSLRAGSASRQQPRVVGAAPSLMLCPCFWVVLSQGYFLTADSHGVFMDGCLALESSNPARSQIDPETFVVDAARAFIAPVSNPGVCLELLVGAGLSHCWGG